MSLKLSTTLSCGLLIILLAASSRLQAAPPNIIYILADDLGYGDVRCLNAKGKIATPHMDRIAREGMIFTDAHSGSAVCTPTRYGIITGRYAWRTRLQNGVLGGLSPRLIEPGRRTVADLLRENGYHTAAVGKWHLGMDWTLKPGTTVNDLSIESPEQVWNVAYDQPIANGPLSVGFDYYFGISASLDMVPYTYIENDRVTQLPTEDQEFQLYEGRPGRMCRRGPTAPGFHTSHVLPKITEKAIQFIDGHATGSRSASPFFLYFPLNSPHTAIAPTEEWLGKSGISPYADFVMQTDATIGAVLDALDRHRLAENTLIVVTSDNGCSPSADFPELAQHGHDPSYVFRGHKADIFEGGHRIPFLVRWPARVKPGTTSDQIVCLTDLYATCNEILGKPVAGDAAEDSVSFLPALLGKSGGRESIVHHSINGSFAIRQGSWKLELCRGSGGWSAPRPNAKEAANLPPLQLYDLSKDIAEQTNVAEAHPEVVARLTKLLEEDVARGRSTPGVPRTNAVPINVRK
jgi:arylsulfatase A-like enzyme